MEGDRSPAPGAVYVVDDDEGVRRALSRLLRSAGYRAEAFASPREFLAHALPAGTACLVLDVQMPDMTGPELQQHMAERGVRLPVIFLTARGDVPTSVRAMKKGAVDFLLKPVDDALLLRTVAEALARHAADSAKDLERETVLARLARLTPRERQVLEHVLRGRLNKQAAADLGIALKTVKVHRSRVMEKMECGSVAELVRDCELAGFGAPEGKA
jgi:FixJ family two-component response regulator